MVSFLRSLGRGLAEFFGPVAAASIRSPSPEYPEMPDTVVIEPMDRASRGSFARWLAMEPIDQLAAQLGSPLWQDGYRGRIFRLESPDKEALKSEVLARVRAAGGRVAVGGVVLTYDGGADELRVSVGLPGRTIGNP